MAKKIILFHHEFCVSGGAEHTLFEVMDYLKDSGIDYQCFTSIIDKNNCFPDKIQNYKIYSFFPYSKKIPRIIYPVLMALLSPLLLLRFSNASLFYGANQSGPFLAYVASLIHRRPYIIYMPYPLTLLYPRNIDKQFEKVSKSNRFTKIVVSLVKPPLYLIDKQIIKKASAVLSEGQYAVELFKKIYGKDIINAPAGADLISEQELNSINRFDGNLEIPGQTIIPKPYILLTNRHVPKKKFEYAILAIQKIKKLSENNNATPMLVITGDHTEYTIEIKKLSDRLGVSKNLIFTDLIPEDQILSLYKNAAVYVYTAPEEDYGKGVIQALASGTPSVVWDNAGPGKNIINSQTGYTVKLDDIEDYAQKIFDILSDRQLQKRLSANAYQNASQYFSKKAHRSTIMELVRKYHSI
jgi:glycosyltransferase involved in cell wall biosynthesis